MGGFFLWFCIILFIVISLFMILLILIQKGRGGGLSGAFGGAGGNTAFGSKTGDVLTWATSIVFGIFLLLAIVLNWITRPGGTTAVAPPPPAPYIPSPATPPPALSPELSTTTPPAPPSAPGDSPAPAEPAAPPSQLPTTLRIE